MDKKAQSLQKEYKLRFSKTKEYRDKVWKTLCNKYFNRYIAPVSSVLDMGAGWGEFITNINASDKYAIDLNPDAKIKLKSDVQFLQQDCSLEWNLPANSLDVVFSSNFLEHLPDKAHIESAISEAYRCLQDDGLIILLGPNIKYVHGAYWDFWDHYIPLTEEALSEVLLLKGFQVQVKIPRFLPYSMSTGSPPPLIFPEDILAPTVFLAFFWKAIFNCS